MSRTPSEIRQHIDTLRFLLDRRGADLKPHLSEAAKKDITRIERADIERQLAAAQNELKEKA